MDLKKLPLAKDLPNATNRVAGVQIKNNGDRAEVLFPMNPYQGPQKGDTGNGLVKIEVGEPEPAPTAGEISKYPVTYQTTDKPDVNQSAGEIDVYNGKDGSDGENGKNGVGIKSIELGEFAQIDLEGGLYYVAKIQADGSINIPAELQDGLVIEASSESGLDNPLFGDAEKFTTSVSDGSRWFVDNNLALQPIKKIGSGGDNPPTPTGASIPVGHIGIWGLTIPPSNYFILNGGDFPADLFPDLDTYFQNFPNYTKGKLPDWTDRVPRQAGNLIQLNENQEDALQNIKGKLGRVPYWGGGNGQQLYPSGQGNGLWEGAITVDPTDFQSGGWPVGNGASKITYTLDASLVARTAEETRAKGVGVNFIVYAGLPAKKG